MAFAVGRAVGPAVTRNLVRRQLRQLLAAADLPPGWYLIGARPDAARRSFLELEQDVQTLSRSIIRSYASPPIP